MTRVNTLLLVLLLVLGVGSVWRLKALFVGMPSVQTASTPAAISLSQNKAEAAIVPTWRRPLLRLPGTSADMDTTGSIETLAKAPKLLGVLAEDGKRLAVLALDGKVLRVTENYKIGPWTVVRVDPHSALLESVQTYIRLRLDPNTDRN
jgi:hypothetical protein